MAKNLTRKSLYSAEYELFLKVLREVRESAGMTQIQAARKLNRPQSFVSKCESGERRVDIVELTLFCQVYRISLIHFLKRLEDAT